jgi:hypothetical protein
MEVRLKPPRSSPAPSKLPYLNLHGPSRRIHHLTSDTLLHPLSSSTYLPRQFNHPPGHIHLPVFLACRTRICCCRHLRLLHSRLHRIAASVVSVTISNFLWQRCVVGYHDCVRLAIRLIPPSLRTPHTDGTRRLRQLRRRSSSVGGGN